MPKMATSAVRAEDPSLLAAGQLSALNCADVHLVATALVVKPSPPGRCSAESRKSSEAVPLRVNETARFGFAAFVVVEGVTEKDGIPNAALADAGIANTRTAVATADSKASFMRSEPTVP